MAERNTGLSAGRPVADLLRRAHLAAVVAGALLIGATWRINQAWAVYPGIVLVALAGLLVAGRAERCRTPPAAAEEQRTPGTGADPAPDPRRSGRVIWALMGLGLLCYGASAFLLVLTSLIPGFPSIWSYLCALTAYGCETVALVRLMRADAPVYRATALLDAAVVTLGVCAVAVAVFGPVLEGSEGGLITALTLLAYPAGDLLVLCVALGGLAVLGWPWHSHWGLLAGGFTVFAVFDSAYLISALHGTLTGGLLVDSLWPFGGALLVAAAHRPEPPRQDSGDGARLWLLPFAVIVVSLGILVGDEVGLEVPAAAAGLAAGAVLVAFVRMSLTFREVSELVETRRQAHHDDLTDLPNRRRLYGRLEHGLATRAEGHRLALLMLDLNRFKEVNDALGHGIGDELLCEVARQLEDELADVVAAGGLLARLGGDEFAVLLPDCDLSGAEEVAERIGRALDRPFPLDDVTLHIDASIGLAVCPDHATGRTALLRCADVAMYQAKRAKMLHATYAPTHHVYDRAHLEALDHLHQSMTVGHFVCHFQAKADLRSGRIVGAEALVRWQHPDRGLLMPDAFLPLVEQTGRMRRLTEIVLDQALGACRSWRDGGLELTVAVNLSAANLLDGDLVDHVRASLSGHGLPGAVLRLEITEDVLMADPERAAETMEHLRRLGVAVSMDDYGTGYSSLSYLRQLPIDELKLDRSFITDVSSRPRDLAIVASTVDLAHALGLIVVAEGVESEEDWTTLTRLGCDQAQGYHLSRPLPGPDFVTLVEERRAAVATVAI
jgi:diguanylate cyclase